MKWPCATPAFSPPFSKSWKFSALRQLVGSELGVCWLGVFHRWGILLRDALFHAPQLPGRCALCFLADRSLARVPFKAHLLRWLHVVRVSIFTTRPGNSGSFLTKLCLFFPFLLSLCLTICAFPAVSFQRHCREFIFAVENIPVCFLGNFLLAQGLLTLRRCHLWGILISEASL